MDVGQFIFRLALVIVFFFGLVVTVLHLIARRRLPQDIVVGGVYDVKVKGHDGFSKVVVLSRDSVHVILYKNRYTDQPEHVDSEQVLSERIDDRDVSREYLELSMKSFLRWKPRLLARHTVTSDDLECRPLWKHLQKEQPAAPQSDRLTTDSQ